VRHDGADRRSTDQIEAACCMRDGGRPSGNGLQDQFSNRPSLRGDEIPGSEQIGEKAGLDPVRYESGRANASEPLMSCRKRLRCHRNQASFRCLGQSPAGACLRAGWWPADRWREPGSGFHVERGNLALRCQGSNPRESTLRVRVPKRSAGADRLVVVMKPGNAGGAKGPNRPASDVGQPARGGAYA